MTEIEEAMVDPANRCTWAIKFGTLLTTRCILAANHGHLDTETGRRVGALAGHIGRGNPEFPYQRIHWFPGDRREFTTARDDLYAWEQS